MNVRKSKWILLVAALLFFSVGCTQQESNNNVSLGVENSSISAEESFSSFSESSVELDGNTGYTISFEEFSNWDAFLNTWVIEDNLMYVLKSIENIEERQMYYQISVLDAWEDFEYSSISLPFHSALSMSCQGMQVGANDTIWLLVSNFSEEQGEQLPFHLMRLNWEGELLEDIVLDDVTGLEKGNYSCLLKDSNDFFYIYEGSEQQIFVFDENGNLQGNIESDEKVDFIVCSKDSLIYAFKETKEKTNFWQVETEGLKLSENKIEMPITGLSQIQAGLSRDFIGMKDSKLVEISLSEQKVYELFDWTDKGIDWTKICSLTRLDDNTVLAVLYNSQDRRFDLLRVQQTDKKAEDITLTVASLCASRKLKEYIIDFNRNHSNMIIQLNEYYDETDTEALKEDALKRLNADIVAGTAGDILDLVSLQGLTSKRYYAQKGALENLYDWMEADSEVYKENFLPNLLDASEIDGRLYDLIAAFEIDTMVGKTSLVGDSVSWTWDETIQLMQNYPELELFNAVEVSREDFLYMVCEYNQDILVDWEERSCQFDSDTFAAYLEYAIQLPDKADMDKVIAGRTSWDKAYKGELVFIEETCQSNVLGYRGAEALFGEEISLIGFPTMDGSVGSVFMPLIDLGILTSSQKKETAWSFLKGFLEEEYQNTRTLEFPVLTDSIQKCFQVSVENDEYAMSGFGAENFIVDYGEIKQSQIDAVNDLLPKVTKLSDVDTNIYQIIVEEAGYYFAGQRTAQQACEMIQSRVSLYLME